MNQTVHTILYRLADNLGTAVHNRTLQIPDNFGSGYCSSYVFNQNIRMLISNYELKEDLLVMNPEVDVSRQMLFFKFQNIFPLTQSLAYVHQGAGKPVVLIGTSRVNSDEVLAIHSNTSTINIEVEAAYLKGQFSTLHHSPLLQALFENNQPLLFEQVIYPSLQRIVKEILNAPNDETFVLYFLRIKAEELICKLLMELEKRNETHFYTLNNRDIKAIYQVREHLLKQLDIPPIIKDLTTLAGMSSTKLKRLFKQVFGYSIFNYYQQFRIQEGARLLSEEKLSVSEVGYRLGFTNLSHFTRVFNAHVGMNPKHYSLMYSDKMSIN